MEIASAPYLRSARRSELEELSALALRSKAYWGYDKAFLAACEDALTLPANALEEAEIWVAQEGQALLGFLRLVALSTTVAEVYDLFVEPEHVGKGVGALLLSRAVHHARKHGLSTVRVEADPNAAAFYERCGFRPAGEVISTVDPTRALPVLECTL